MQLDQDVPVGTIWKYPILPRDVTMHDVPEGSKALYVGADVDGNMCVWFLVRPEAPKEPRAIVLVGTGDELPATAAKDYVGTFVAGELVHHVFAPPTRMIQTQ